MTQPTLPPHIFSKALYAARPAFHVTRPADAIFQREMARAIAAISPDIMALTYEYIADVKLSGCCASCDELAEELRLDARRMKGDK